MPEKILEALTVRHLRLTEGKKEEFVGDGANLFVRLRPRSRDWVFVWKVDGKKHKLMLGSLSDLSLAEARERAREARAQIADGKHPRVEREKRRAEQFALDQAQGALPQSVNELFETWFEKEVKSRYGDEGAEVRRRFEKDVAPALGKRPPQSVAEDDIVSVLDKVAGRGAKRIAGLLLADLRQMFKFAVRRKMATFNPTEELNKKDWSGESVERKRALSENEILLLRKQLPDAKLIPETECAIWILLGTACRVGELTQSRWDQIVGDELMLPMELTKTKEPHTVVLSPFVRRQLKRLKSLNPKSEWIFPAKHNEGAVDKKSITKQITHRQRGKSLKGRSPAVTSLRLPGGLWHIHDLRRTAATLMQKRGVLPPVIEAVLNHTEPNRMKRIYQQHKYKNEMRDAWLRLGTYLDQLMRKKLPPTPRVD
jgi:integrase